MKFTFLLVNNNLNWYFHLYKVFLCCANSTYQTRSNCLYELREAVAAGKTTVALLLESKDPPANTWTPSDELKSALQFSTRMYCDLSTVAAKDGWKEAESRGEEPSEALLKVLATAVEPLLKIMIDVQCLPSLAL